MKKLNNKGFTLVELLAVLVILIAIMSIAIPSISSSLERSKSKQDTAKQKILESAAELYVTDHKNSITAATCSITTGQLKTGNYIDDAVAKDSNGSDFSGCIKYTKSTSTFEYLESGCGSSCIS